jgi:hypothetical protein
VRLITGTAKLKGWESWVQARDSKTYRYATVSVSRYASNQEITGTFEITCDERARITYHKTSFHSWGLEDLYDAIGNEFWKLPWVKPKVNQQSSTSPSSDSGVTLIKRFLRRFHQMAKVLKHRHNQRAAFCIEDEYDVQDLLHAVLRGLFDDVRPEEYTPSYAGGASRMDFLLKTEKIVIETKIASELLRDKQIGEQLIIDIKRYQSHPDCSRLICFVYDPHGNLKNPSGLEADLTRVHDKVQVDVIVLSL